MPGRHVTALQKGTRVDSFEIRSVLGSGAFGITYLAYDHDLAQPVALKEFCPARLASRCEDGATLRSHSSSHRKYFNSGRAAFLAEARTLAQFRHPAIVRVTRHLEQFGTAYIAMDYERGETLRARLRAKSAIDEKAAHDVLEPLLAGLGAVHSRQFLHGDIKPENVLIRADGSPVLIDFGAARGDVTHRQRASFHTFTPAYAPPELHADTQAVGPWSDVYCVGATLYHCLSGHPPPPATERVFACYFGHPDPLDLALERSLAATHAASAVTISRALELDIDKRLKSVDDFLMSWAGDVNSPPRLNANEATPCAKSITRTDSSTPHFSSSEDEQASTDSLDAPLPSVVISAEIKRLVENHLGEQVGMPLAKRLAVDHAEGCRSHDEYYQRLATHIESDGKREEFIAAVMLGEYLR